VYESAHPYENNVNFEETIRFPGATKLQIVFDPQTKTESGCDVVRFYNAAGDSATIYEHSGSDTWPELTVIGDSVHYKFTTDSSCVEWGYKFTVYPTFPPKAGNEDPLAHKMNAAHAHWIIDFVLSYDTIPASLTLFSSKYIINPLTVLMYTSST
jgi:hypothetical protein